MFTAGIDVEHIKIPKHLQKSTFEMFEKYGIEGTRKQLPKKGEICQMNVKCADTKRGQPCLG